MGKAGGEESVDEGSEEIFIVGLGIEEGLLVTELLVPEVQTKVFLAEEVLVLKKTNQQRSFIMFYFYFSKQDSLPQWAVGIERQPWRP